MKINKVELEKIKLMFDTFQKFDKRFYYLDKFLRQKLDKYESTLSLLDEDEMCDHIKLQLSCLQEDSSLIKENIEWFQNLKDVEVDEDGIL